MFLYMYTIFRENKMPIFKNQTLLRSCYLEVLISVAALSYKLVTRKRYKCTYLKLVVIVWLKQLLLLTL
jgi:hypothetical protein